MKNLGGPLLLGGVIAIAVGTGIPNQFLNRNSRPPEEDISYPQAGSGSGGMGSQSGTTAENQFNPNGYPPPPEGTIPSGYNTTREGTAALCFDGTGYSPAGDTFIPATAHTMNGQYLNGDTTPYVVVNRADYGNVPLGSKVYVYNHNTGKGTWAVAGDRGPDNIGKAEMRVATANAIGADIPRDQNGNMKNAIAPHQISYYFYDT